MKTHKNPSTIPNPTKAPKIENRAILAPNEGIVVETFDELVIGTDKNRTVAHLRPLKRHI